MSAKKEANKVEHVVSEVPTDVDRAAPALVRREIVIAAPLETVWLLHVDIARWPEWQKDISVASIDGPIAIGGRFTWETAGMPAPIVSTIYSLNPHKSVFWGGPAAGITGLHHWSFEPAMTGTRVITEESWSGASIDADPAKASSLLGASLDRWLRFLTDAATQIPEAPNATHSG